MEVLATKNILVLYWSCTGNTKKMAELITKGAQDAGAAVKLAEFEYTNQAELESFDIIAMGCPAMGAEVLEEIVVQPFVDEADFSVKKVALFGSYDWGDGEWIRDWADDMNEKGAIVVAESLAINNAPEGSDADRCIEFGKLLAS